MTTSAARPPASTGVAAFLRRSVATPSDALLTAVVALVVAAVAIPLSRWALIGARWTGSAEDCRAASGACWAFVGHKLAFVVFGLYPPNERWRASIALTLLVALIAVGIGGRFSRLAAAAVAVITVGWVIGMIVAIVAEKPLW